MELREHSECSVSNGLMGVRSWRAAADPPDPLGNSFAPLSPAQAARSMKARWTRAPGFMLNRVINP